jgi:DNA-binding NtrC family response regulator
MPKEVKLLQEMEAAAAKVVELGIPQTRAKDLFRYAVLKEAEKRAEGNQSQAALGLGMSSQAFNQALKMLQARLS